MRNSAGVLGAAATPVWRLTGTSTCSSKTLVGVACVGNTKEIKASYTYAHSNLLMTSQTEGPGDNTGSQTATTLMTYDAVGNQLTDDGPMSGTADTTRYHYDAARQIVGAVLPDPDGAGSQISQAVRTSYNLDGQVTLVEDGTATGQTDTAWSSFVSLQGQAKTYDALGRLTQEVLTSGGVSRTANQYAYDNANRLICAALRMNPAVFAALPSACTLSNPGADGPDRITQYGYSAADEVLTETSGLGTALQQVTKTSTYGPSGQLSTLADANGNLTTFEYDGFNRLAKTRYPVAANGTVSSTTDFEQITYDAASNVTTQVRRGGQSVTYTYDALNRLTAKSLPSTAYSYDNADRLRDVTVGAQTVAYTYDALGNTLTETTPQGVMTSEYNLDETRSRLTWPDGFYVTYVYDQAGALTAIRENGVSTGAAVLATFTYDDLGRRTGVTRGNGVTTTYGYDTASNLSSLAQNLLGTANDQTYGLSHNLAGQVTARTTTSAAYDWPSLYNYDRSYTNNGLNQMTTAGAQTVTHDTRGNLTSDGVQSYAYDADNHLTTFGPTTLSYDPQGRLYQVVDSAATRFAYDGDEVVGEYNSGGILLRRYVRGPDLDEPLVWYEGTGTSDRRWLVADPLGSIVAATDAAGASLVTNTYDEYGMPGTSNLGRFQYTGQMWLAGAQLYHYKARAYSPYLGRFMQADPTGYGDGMNLYAYVSNDPINSTDPMGLETCDLADSGCIMGEVIVRGHRYVPDPTEDRAAVERAQESFRALRDGAATVGSWIVPGWDAMACNSRDCLNANGGLNAQGWIAVAGMLPAGKVAKLAKLEKVAKLCNCFEAGTLVATPGGHIPIEQLAVGDLVLSRSDVTGETAAKPIAALIPGKSRPIWDVVVAFTGKDGLTRTDTIHTTEEHPFHTTDGKWTEAADLRAGALLSTAQGASTRVISVASVGRTVPTYNLEVKDFHTYFVGENELWVHNACKDLVKLAKELGYKLDKGYGRLHGQDVFKSGGKFISRDVDKHSGGFWKMFDRQGNRIGTYNKDLTKRIGE